MREIKFRAWDKENNIMLSNQNLDDYDKDGIMHVYDILKDQEKEGVELMQFTGLKDKNGVDIYEGDIVQYISRITNILTKSEIFFEGGCFCFGSLKCDTMFNELEIIGNIYENPELLK